MHAQSCLTLCDPLSCSPPGSFVHGIFQARILEWVATSYSTWSSQPKYQTHISCISYTCRWIIYHCTTWEAYIYNYFNIKLLILCTYINTELYIFVYIYIISHISIGLWEFSAPWQFSVSDPGGDWTTSCCCWTSPRPSGPQSLDWESSERERTWSKHTPFFTTLTLKW